MLGPPNHDSSPADLRLAHLSARDCEGLQRIELAPLRSDTCGRGARLGEEQGGGRIGVPPHVAPPLSTHLVRLLRAAASRQLLFEAQDVTSGGGHPHCPLGGWQVRRALLACRGSWLSRWHVYNVSQGRKHTGRSQNRGCSTLLCRCVGRRGGTAPADAALQRNRRRRPGGRRRKGSKGAARAREFGTRRGRPEQGCDLRVTALLRHGLRSRPILVREERNREERNQP